MSVTVDCPWCAPDELCAVHLGVTRWDDPTVDPVADIREFAAAAWDEAQHPRDPGGEGGGQWIPKGAVPSWGTQELVGLEASQAVRELDNEIKDTWEIGDARQYAREAVQSIALGAEDRELLWTVRKDGALVATGSAYADVEYPEGKYVHLNYGGAIRGGGMPMFRQMLQSAAERDQGMRFAAGTDSAEKLYDRMGFARDGPGPVPRYVISPEEVKVLADDLFAFVRKPRGVRHPKPISLDERDYAPGFAPPEAVAAAAVAEVEWPDEWTIGPPLDPELVAAAFVEEKHPRHPKGKREGGRFRKLYHVTPVSNRLDIQTEGLTLDAPRRYTDDPEAGVYFFDDPDDAWKFATTGERMYGDFDIWVTTDEGIELAPDPFFEPGAPMAERAVKQMGRRPGAFVTRKGVPASKLQLHFENPWFTDEKLRELRAMRGAAWDETKHPRHPSGSELGGEFAPKLVPGTSIMAVPGPPPIEAEPAPAPYDPQRVDDAMVDMGLQKPRFGEEDMPPRSELPRAFPPGEFDPTGPVKYWPQEMGAYSGFRQDMPYGPFWKAVLDNEGNEVAFWFANVNGYPHHDDMISALMRADAWPNTPGYTHFIAGYGNETDMNFSPDSETERRLGQQMRHVPIRHRRDIRDANEFLRQERPEAAMAAAAWDESKVRRHPKGTELGGEFAPKAGRFPPGVFAPDDSVKFWPERISSLPASQWPVGHALHNQEGPLWKALLDAETGEELAFWFAGVHGKPHHGDVQTALGIPGGPENRHIAVSGYGDEADWQWMAELEMPPQEVEWAKQIPKRHRKDIDDARQMTEAMAAATYVEAEHPRDPGGEGGGQWISKGSNPEGFPPGVFDQDDSAMFWPNAMGSDAHGEPFWKAIQQNGETRAFWFVNNGGAPHHDDMGTALGLSEVDGELRLVAGYGDQADVDWNREQMMEWGEFMFEAEDIYELNKEESSYTLNEKYGRFAGDFDDMTVEEIRAELIDEELDKMRRVPREHRRDIADARQMKERMVAAATPDAITVEFFNEVVEAEAAKLQKYEARLAKVYRGVIHDTGVALAKQFERLAPDAIAAAADPPADWSPPTVAELISAIEANDEAIAAAKALQAASFEQMVEGVLARIGISFEVRAILTQALLNGLGARAIEMIEGIRVPVARAVANSYLNGLSVPQTAEAIMAAVDGLEKWQATQLARNDLVGIANGGSLTSARLVREKFPEVGLAYKEWLATDDERTRPTHNEAHGQRVPLEAPFRVGEGSLAYPGDPSGPDSEVINCRCTLIYRQEPTAITAAFDETKHPRDPGGDKGGEFIEKGSTAPDERAGMPWKESLSKLTEYTVDDVRAGRVPGIVEAELREGVAAHAREAWITVRAGEFGEGIYRPDGSLDTILVAHEAGHYVANEIGRESDAGMSIPELEPFMRDTGFEMLPDPPADNGRIHVKRKSDGAEMWVYPPPRSYENPWGVNPNVEEILADTYSQLLHSDPFEEPDSDFARPRQALLDRVAKTAKKMGLPHKRVYRVKHDGPTELVGAAVREYTRYPKGTDVAPGGKGPGGGRFAPDAGVGVEDEEEAREYMSSDAWDRPVPPVPKGGKEPPSSWSGPPIAPTSNAMYWADEDWTQERTQAMIRKSGLDEDAYKAAVEARALEDMDARFVAIRTPSSLVDEIEADGRFKSQFETDSSGGSLAPTTRATFEQNVFSYPSDLPDEQRPIYGYLSTGGNEGGSPVSQYGDVTWELKREVRDRTTFTSDDSLGYVQIPSPVRAPAWYSVKPPVWHANSEWSHDPKSDPLGSGLYVEAQIHGGLSLDDVDTVTFPRHVAYLVDQGGSTLPSINPHWAEENALVAAVKKLRARGINVEFA